jgi:hypothetical protein
MKKKIFTIFFVIAIAGGFLFTFALCKGHPAGSGYGGKCRPCADGE